MSIQHLMWDLECLGMDDSCVITALSIVPFTFEGNETYDDLVSRGLFVKFSAKDQIENYGRTTDDSTVTWWKQQSPEAKAFSVTPSPSDVPFEQGLDQITRFVATSGVIWKSSYNWSRGSSFDFPKIEHAYRHTNLKLPYNTWRIRDVRTYMDILAGSTNGMYQLKNGEPKSFTKHHALHDAALDALKMKEVYQNNL